MTTYTKVPVLKFVCVRASAFLWLIHLLWQLVQTEMAPLLAGHESATFTFPGYLSAVVVLECAVSGGTRVRCKWWYLSAVVILECAVSGGTRVR